MQSRYIEKRDGVGTVLTKTAAGLKNRTQPTARLLEEYLSSWATLPNRAQVKALGRLIRPKKMT
jgi:hypothetical protein